jgi:hypothetical protein
MPRKLVPSLAARLIADTFSYISDPTERPPALSGDQAGELTGLIAVIDAIPSELITLDAPELARFTSAMGRLRYNTNLWVARGPGNYSVNGRYLREVHDLLRMCPDSVPKVATTQLDFIGDVDLREELRQDISWATDAFVNGDWKAATVLGGAVVEALLLWALEQQDPKTVAAGAAAIPPATVRQPVPLDLHKWTLHQYAEVTGSLGLISTNTLTQVRLVKDFRNLVHPGKAARLAKRCDRGTALAALAAVEMVARDLT